MITSCGGSDQPAPPPKTTAALDFSQSEAIDIATEAYVYAYPLVTMEYTRRSFTNVPGPEDTKAPMGQFVRMRTFPNAASRAATIEVLARDDADPDQLRHHRCFDPSKLPAAAATGIAMAPKLAQDNIADWREDGVVAGALVSRNGWAYTIKAGSYGTDYRQRAFVTEVGVGANLPEDAVYPMYGSDYFFVDNPLNRYTLSARDTFIENPDGSTDIYIQADSPGPDKEANWLPAPKDRFSLMLRLYWPKETKPSILAGTWHIPPVKPLP